MRRASLLLLGFITLTLAACGPSRSRGPTGDSAVLPDSGLPPGDSAVLPDAPMGDGGGSDATVVDSPLVDPTCVDGMYSEALPNPSASIDDLIASYDPSAFQSFIDGVLDRRFPIGAYMVRGGRTNTRFGGDCDALFLGTPTPTSDMVFQRLGVVVHECGHLYDLTAGGFGTYYIREDLTISCSMGDTIARGGRTFARAELTGDEYFPTRADSYADVYLIGDGSEQGFSSVLEEAQQYVNSLANAYAFADRRGPGASTSAKDGILSFLWYIERYLRLARLEYPDAYAFILGDACWREMILTVWGRAWLFLELTRDNPALGVRDGELFPVVEDPELVAEIQAVRDAHGCGI